MALSCIGSGASKITIRFLTYLINNTKQFSKPKIPMSEDTTKNQNTTNTSTTQGQGSWSPDEVPQLTVDVYRKEDTIYVVSTVAGVNPTDLDISMENNTLSIKGVRAKPYSENQSNMLLEECFWGEFYRELTINENLDVERINASLNQGVLIIEIPILKIASQKKITVNHQ
jgi:HSP20 family protein